METRVTYRAAPETVKRLQHLSDKYGISQSALLTMLVNERWLAESRVTSAGVKVVAREGSGAVGDPEQPPDFPEYVETVGKKKRKRRHR